MTELKEFHKFLECEKRSIWWTLFFFRSQTATELGSYLTRHSYFHCRHFSTYFGCSSRQLWNHQTAIGPWSNIAYATWYSVSVSCTLVKWWSTSTLYTLDFTVVVTLMHTQSELSSKPIDFASLKAFVSSMKFIPHYPHPQDSNFFA